MQELKIRQQENNQTASESQTTREGADKYTDTKPSVIKKELAEGQPYQIQEFTIRQQEKARSDHKRKVLV